VRDGVFSAYEFKWNEKAKAKFSVTFIDKYSPSITKNIHPNNLEDFIID
jgi:uncharacterized protein